MENVICALTYADKDADVRAFFHVPQAYDSDGEPIGDISVSHNNSHQRTLLYAILTITEFTSIGWMNDRINFLEHSFSDRTIFIQPD